MKCFQDRPGTTILASRLIARLQRVMGCFFSRFDGIVIVGTFLAGYDGHRGWLYSIAVSLDRQRCGIGTTLVRHAEQVLAERGCPKLNLQVRADNAAVVAFYESLGYQTEERISMGKLLGD